VRPREQSARKRKNISSPARTIFVHRHCFGRRIALPLKHICATPAFSIRVQTSRLSFRDGARTLQAFTMLSISAWTAGDRAVALTGGTTATRILSSEAPPQTRAPSSRRWGGGVHVDLSASSVRESCFSHCRHHSQSDRTIRSHRTPPTNSLLVLQSSPGGRYVNSQELAGGQEANDAFRPRKDEHAENKSRVSRPAAG